jgi:type I restriction enzyme, S subunit
LKFVRVSDVLQLDRRPAAIDPLAEYEPIGIRSFGKGIFHYPPTLGSDLSKLRYFEVHPETLVVSNIKAWEGAIAVASDAEMGRIASNRFLSYVPVDNQIDVRYAAHFFLSERGLPLIQRASPGSADRNRTLAIDRFENLEVPLPSLAEQHEIVRRLEGTYRRLQRIDRDAGHAGTLVAGLRAAAFRPTAPKVALEAVLEQVVRAEEVDAVREYRMLGVRSFGLGCFDAGLRQGAETRYRLLHRVAAGDFVYPKLMAWEGAFGVVPERFDGYFVSPEFCTFQTVGQKLNIGYLGALFRIPGTWSSIAGSSIGTNVRRRRLYPRDFLVREIPLPDWADQNRIAALATRLDEVTRISTRRSDLAAALRVSALNDAFRAAA